MAVSSGSFTVSTAVVQRRRSERRGGCSDQITWKSSCMSLGRALELGKPTSPPPGFLFLTRRFTVCVRSLAAASGGAPSGPAHQGHNTR
jgi:hypothetical protein